MNKILVMTLVLFGSFIFAGVHVANGHYENDNLGQTITHIAHPHKSNQGVESQSSSNTQGKNASQIHHNDSKDHRVNIND